jgi:hypothetical protein
MARSRCRLVRVLYGVLIAVVLPLLGDTVAAGPTNLPSWLPVAAPAFVVCWAASTYSRGATSCKGAVPFNSSGML